VAFFRKAAMIGAIGHEELKTVKQTVTGNLHRVTRMEAPTDLVYKLIVVGDAGVGKTALARRYTEGKFDETYLFTLGVDFFTKIAKVKGHRVKLVVYDTGGQERFDFIRGLYFEGSAGAVIAYDVTNRKSFDRVGHWKKQVEQRCEGIPLILVGCKVDLEERRAVSRQEGEARAKQEKMVFVESSAKADQNVSDVFQKLADMVWDAFEKEAGPGKG
jgi:small GTP-binding protein